MWNKATTTATIITLIKHGDLMFYSICFIWHMIDNIIIISYQRVLGYLMGLIYISAV